MKQIFELWEEAEMPRENPHMQKHTSSTRKSNQGLLAGTTVQPRIPPKIQFVYIIVEKKTDLHDWPYNQDSRKKNLHLVIQPNTCGGSIMVWGHFS